MRAGRLRHRVSIQSLVATLNTTTGEVTDTWTEFASVKAAVEPVRASEFSSADQTQAKVLVNVIIRYRSGILSSMQVVHGDHTYQIQGILPDGRTGREYITLPCSEVERG